MLADKSAQNPCQGEHGEHQSCDSPPDLPDNRKEPVEHTDSGAASTCMAKTVGTNDRVVFENTVQNSARSALPHSSSSGFRSGELSNEQRQWKSEK
jgi:hypothetical protein